MANSLKINVFLIPEEGQRFVFSEGDTWFQGCFRDSEKPDFVLKKVDVDCLITMTSGTVFIKGSFSAFIDICCSRCLEHASLPIGGDFNYTLIPAKAETREDLELTPEELEITYYQGDFIDLAPIICEQLILQIPMKALCTEECKGLCPHCGMNLNRSSCNCHLNVVNDRMAVLKNFRVKN
ncbi:protein, clustered with ribosomal protein l32p [hydrocarbon metagenome]|uniref:Protein, clustered with ribosomal protein l32p n=1 Tax=hydrocarbon metagenome TaxID=938273 RepID=A0A0W8FS15_9ZZZZ